MKRKDIVLTIATLIVVGLICFAVCNAPAQEKPKDVKLSGTKISARLAQIAKAMDERADKVLTTDLEYQRLFSLYRGLAMANDTTLQVTDSTITPKKGTTK